MGEKTGKRGPGLPTVDPYKPTLQSPCVFLDNEEDDDRAIIPFPHLALIRLIIRASHAEKDAPRAIAALRAEATVI